MVDVNVFVVSPLTLRAFQYEFQHPGISNREFVGHLERLLIEQHKHRYDMFVDFLGWRSKHIVRDDTSAIEHDAYDRDNAIYSIAADDDFNFLGCTRAYSTTLPYMLEEDEFQGTCYPGLSLPKDPHVFEGSRIISPNSKLYEGTRVTKPIRVATPLLFSHLELGTALGLEAYVGTMPPTLLEKSYGRMGWKHQPIGPATLITDENDAALDQGDITQNYRCEISDDVSRSVREATGINYRVSNFGVSDRVIPSLLQHMRDNADILHPHRTHTDLAFNNQHIVPLREATR